MQNFLLTYFAYIEVYKLGETLTLVRLVVTLWHLKQIFETKQVSVLLIQKPQNFYNKTIYKHLTHFRSFCYLLVVEHSICPVEPTHFLSICNIHDTSHEELPRVTPLHSI